MILYHIFFNFLVNIIGSIFQNFLIKIKIFLNIIYLDDDGEPTTTHPSSCGNGF